MRYEPKSKEKIQEDKLIPAGVWPFEVATAVDGQSKKAKQRGEAENDMITLELYVTINHKQRTQRDWLGGWNGGEEKIQSFCEATGVQYSGDMKARDCVDATGFVEIRHKESDGFGLQSQAHLYIPADGVEAAQARIAAYEAKRGNQAPAEQPKQAVVFMSDVDMSNDDVPF